MAAEGENSKLQNKLQLQRMPVKKLEIQNSKPAEVTTNNSLI